MEHHRGFGHSARRALVRLGTDNGKEATVYPVAISEAENCKKLWQLDLNLATLEFTHQPFFSQEHVLVQRFQEHYEQCQTKQGNNTEKSCFPARQDSCCHCHQCALTWDWLVYMV